MTKRKVTLIPGDGIGPEVSLATQRCIEAAGVAIDWEIANAGAEVMEAERELERVFRVRDCGTHDLVHRRLPAVRRVWRPSTRHDDVRTDDVKFALDLSCVLQQP